jgi:hypothetical protein
VRKEAYSEQSCGECLKMVLITLNTHRVDVLSLLLGHLILDALGVAMKVIEISLTGSKVSFFWMAKIS